MSITLFSNTSARARHIIILFFAFIVFTIDVTAQKNDKGFFAGIAIGPSFPTGKFSNKNVTDFSAGWAKPGPAIDISIGYRLSKYWGAVFVLGGQENKQDGNAMANEIRKQNADTLQIRVNTKHWKIGKLSAGAYFNVPLSKSEKIWFESRLLAGIAKTSIPSYSYTAATQPDGNLSGGLQAFSGSRSSLSLPWSFCYQINAGLKFAVAPKIFVTAGLTYFSSEPSQHVTLYPNFPNLSPAIHAKISHPISSINGMAGVELRF